jgi:uncharacterized protein (DUF983 family)
VRFKLTFIMLKDVLKNSGLLIILAGVIILGLVVFTEVQTNSNLGISLGLVIGGLLVHIFINRMVD